MNYLILAREHWRSLTSGSVNRQIFGATLTVGLATLLAKLAGFAKEALVAANFGLSDQLDVFLMAFTLIGFPWSVFMVALQTTFIPTFIQASVRDGDPAAQRLLSKTVALALAVMAVLAVLWIGILPQVLKVVAHGFSPAKTQQVESVTRSLVPYFFLAGLNLMGYGVLQAKKHFFLNGLIPIFLPLSIGFLLVSFGERFQVQVMVWGTNLGAFLEFLALQIALRRRGFKLIPGWDYTRGQARGLINKTGVLAVGTLAMSLNLLISQSMASSLDSGTISALAYGYKIPTTINSLLVSAAGTAVLPFFSEMVARRDWSACAGTLYRYSKLFLLLSLPAVVLMAVLSEPIIKIVFERGSFDPGATAMVVPIQQAYLTLIPSYLLGMLPLQLIIAMGKTHVLTVNSFLIVPLNLLLTWWFMKLWGATGIAVASSVSSLAATFLGFAYVYLSLKKEKHPCA